MVTPELAVDPAALHLGGQHNGLGSVLPCSGSDRRHHPPAREAFGLEQDQAASVFQGIQETIIQFFD